MAQKEPIELVLLKGKKHLSKKEIETRKKEEIKAPKDKIKPPSYLTKELKKEFTTIAKELERIDILTNLDVDALARFVMSKQLYLEVSMSMIGLLPTSDEYMVLIQHQDKLFKQCRSASQDLGLTISSRCKLVMPKKQEEEKPKTESEKRFGGKL